MSKPELRELPCAGCQFKAECKQVWEDCVYNPQTYDFHLLEQLDEDTELCFRKARELVKVIDNMSAEKKRELFIITKVIEGAFK